MPEEQQTQQWTILSLIDWTSRHLTDAGIDEARLTVELLLAEVLDLDRISLYLEFDRPLIPQELTKFKDLYRRRLNHEPLQYILGKTEFMGVPLHLNSSVLIPRPETELLVETALAEIADRGGMVEVLDIGTGSGNIPIAIAKFAANATVTSLDVSNEALKVAGLNIERNAAERITLVHADVFHDVLADRRFDIVIANPPYIAYEEWKQLPPEIKDFEPQIATTDGGDGYAFIRRIIDVAYGHLTSDGWLFMEIAYNQADESIALANERGFAAVDIGVDYAGHRRILKARR